MKENYIFPFLWMRGEKPEILRNEMEKIHEAGINAVCLESRPHPDFAGEGWWHDVDIIIEEARKYGMQIWILDDSHFPTGAANNQMPKHPDKARRFLCSQFEDVTGSVPQAQVDVSLLQTRQLTWMDLGKEEKKPLYEDSRLLSVTALRIDQNDTVDGLPIDLTDRVKDGYLTWDVPEGVWRISVTFDTTDFGAYPDYINYIDSDSVQVLIDEVYEKHYEHYKDLFGTVIAGFFSDEPGFYNTVDYGGDNRVGKRMPLPWGKELEACLKDAYGPQLYKDLPLLFFHEKDGREEPVRTAYMECVSRLYGKNFNQKLGDWCRAHNVQYIGHVVEDGSGYMRLGPGCGHYFRAMQGQDMAGIDNIGYQLMPGNDRATRHTGFQDLEPEFYHYALGKLGASEAAIDPSKKGRLMCENFGAYGWRLGVRDMKWLVDYLVGQGVNHFVPHAFSMAEYPDVDCPPHFYARGNNPQFPYFCHLMRYTDRLCREFSDGKGLVQAGVLFEAEADWAGRTMKGSSVGKQLIQNQIDFLFLPSDIFEDKSICRIEGDGTVLSVNGRQMKTLIVPECDYIPARAAVFFAEHPQFPVIYINRYPEKIAGAVDGDRGGLLKKAVSGNVCIPLEDLADYLENNGICDAIHIQEKNPDLHIYRYQKDGKLFCHLMNVSLSHTVDVHLALPESGWAVYDAMCDTRHALEVKNGCAHIVLPPYGATILESGAEGTAKAEAIPDNVLKQVLPLSSFELTLRGIGKDKPEVISDFRLEPVSMTRRDFAGIMEYRTSFRIEQLPEKAEFLAEHVYECMSIEVNGADCGFAITPPYAVDITGELKKGLNTITVSVASTALRDANTKPGIFGKERTVLEPTGMFGDVEIVMEG